MKVPPHKELAQYFNDEGRCIQYLQQKLILLKGINCLQCNNEMKLDAKMFKYNKHNCRKQISLFNGTIFMNARLSWNKILEIAYLWLIKAKHGTIRDFTDMAETTIT